ncbi:hypothetical protein [Amycolatopsis sp. NBC_01480]|uniref:hypothetical protein n=1 Tax=Amycolatopsis sp. NBC_01480 TaxID=2903562 RepID=UPI002E283F44|nr:hypothetical protein [Amycolatopsis sp. NBC_01480]
MAGLRQPAQEELLTPYADRYLRAVESMPGAVAPEFAVAFARALYPRFTNAGQSVLTGTDRLLESDLLAENVVKVLREERTELVLLRAARECDAAYPRH